MGGQDNLMFSKAHIRRYLLPGMKRMIDLVHQGGAYVFHHDDGNCRRILPDLEVVDLDPVFVFSDREMLWHVFSNILGNAIKFRNTGSPAVIVVSLERSGTHALVEIIDNGIGLDAAETERVFDKFFRAAPTYEGSGVGLSLAKKIVEDLNGMIAISSRGRGKGATVSVSLPAASPDEAERDVPAP